jgi:hypothetical protein
MKRFILFLVSVFLFSSCVTLFQNSNYRLTPQYYRQIKKGQKQCGLYPKPYYKKRITKKYRY